MKKTRKAETLNEGRKLGMTEKVIKKVKIEPIPDGCWIFKLLLSDGEEIVFRIHHEVVLRNLAVEIAERLFPDDAGKIDTVFACMYEYRG